MWCSRLALLPSLLPVPSATAKPEPLPHGCCDRPASSLILLVYAVGEAFMCLSEEPGSQSKEITFGKRKCLASLAHWPCIGSPRLRISLLARSFLTMIFFLIRK